MQLKNSAPAPYAWPRGLVAGKPRLVGDALLSLWAVIASLMDAGEDPEENLPNRSACGRVYTSHVTVSELCPRTAATPLGARFKLTRASVVPVLYLACHHHPTVMTDSYETP